MAVDSSFNGLGQVLVHASQTNVDLVQLKWEKLYGKRTHSFGFLPFEWLRLSSCHSETDSGWLEFCYGCWLLWLYIFMKDQTHTNENRF